MNRELLLGFAPLMKPDEPSEFGAELLRIAELEQKVIEISMVEVEQLFHPLRDTEMGIIRRFAYRSLHAPAVGVRYASGIDQNVIRRMKYLAEQLNPQTIVFHPDVVDDPVWLIKQFGEVVAFENMDCQKHFGTTVADLEKTFAQAPTAKWVCDLNHIFSIDPTMKLTDAFHTAFADRLCHYHLSGYGGFHNCLSITHEDIILTKLLDRQKPIVHEGGAAQTTELLRQEHTYILEKLHE